MKRLVSPSPAVLLALLVWALPVASGAQTTTTYRWVDAQGVVHYSDTPQPGAQVIQLPSAQTYRAPPAPAAAKAASAATVNDPASPYQTCGIAQPPAESSFFAPESIPVTVQLTPGLRPGDQLQVTVDGAPLDQVAAAALQFKVTGPDRGAHTLNATVRDSDGKPVCQSAPVTFYVQRPTLLSPTSPARGH